MENEWTESSRLWPRPSSPAGNRRIGLSAALLVAALAVPGPPVAAGRAFSVPISNRVVEGRILFRDGETADFRVLEGALVTVATPGEGSFYGFSVSFPGSTLGCCQVDVYEIQDLGRGNQTIREMQTLKVRDGASEGTPIRTESRIQILRTDETTLVKTWTPDPRAAMAEELERSLEASAECTLTCPHRIISACSVQASCGSCAAIACADGNLSGAPPEP